MKSEKFENKEMKKAAGMVRVGAILVVVALIGLLVMGVSSCGGSDKDKMQQQLDSLKLANEKLQLAGETEALNQEFQQYEKQAADRTAPQALPSQSLQRPSDIPVWP